MHVKHISLDKDHGILKLSADIQFAGKNVEKMYFSTESKNNDFVSDDASPFLAALLLPCMKRGEDIHIEGPVSITLLENTKKIMELVEGWNVGLNKVNVIASEAKQSIGKKLSTELPGIATPPTTPSKDKLNASFFSAGVDSFYTYLKHKDTSSKIDALILIHGFDIPLKNKSLFTETKNVVEEVAKTESIKAITVETNAGEIIEKYLVWDFGHGGALAAVALFLEKKLNNVYISGGLRKDEIFPYGTHPDLDKLWSTENTHFIHDGTEYNRLGKVINCISKSPLALKYLRVCPQNIKGKYNCSRCYKCLQTMIELVCANALQKAVTFAKLDLNAVKNMYYDYALLYNLQGEANLAVLKKENREPELQKAIEHSLVNSKKKKLSKLVFRSVAAWDQNYNNRRLYRLVFEINKDQDRNMVFKFLRRIGALK